VGRRVLSNLLDENLESLDNLDQPCIIVANDLSPSETANMDMTNTWGLATDGGGPTSHMAILARAFEIPSVVGLRFLGKQIRQDDTLIVDGTHGFVVVRPNESTIKHYEAMKVRIEADRLALMQGTTDGPAVTLDGVEIHTLANIELLAETQYSLKAKCQGIGLYRTEFLFMNRSNLPGEDEQYHSYRKVIEAMAPLPVTMRTLDLGGDKLIPSLYRDNESNPQLGWRSIRMCLDRPDIFKAQLRALLRASVYGPMQIMFPMITGIDQFREAKQVLEEVKDDLTARDVDFDPEIRVGAMIEVPAAVLVSDKLAEESDFFSIGTNDLIQYCLAVDRVNERTAHLYEPTHMGVLRLIKQTLDAARKADIPCTICGEMAGDPMLTELLLGMGAQSLSMTGVSLPMVRAEIANTKMPTAKRLARKVLDLGSASEIKTLLEDRYEQRGTIKLYRDKQG
jgi:phosphoenolpyruvate-protein phosphotransferase (PTS system enzyme I)